MKGQERRVIDLRSQDLSVSDLHRFQESITDSTKEDAPEELIMFSSLSKPYQFASIADLEEKVGSIPDDAGYFYYTISYSSGKRASLYLDPDRPGKVVVEGPGDWIERMDKVIAKTFPRGGERYRVHQRFGIILIWGAIVIIAAMILGAAYLMVDLNPVIISVVIFTSSILGIYLSVVKSRELQPANTISFVKRRKFLWETVMHLVTIVLGIVSAVLAAVIVEGLF
ncbi:MAG: hypothetical protein ACMUHU_06285 [Thermoplasmatota archaeon]